MISLNKFFFLSGLIVVSVFFLFSKNIQYYIFQDDWFVLNIVKNEKLFSLLIPRRDIIYYRPIGMFMFFLISNKLFAFKAVYYHLIVIAFHLLNALLIYKIISISKQKIVAFIAAFAFATASFHFMSISWLSLAWNVIGLSFGLLSIYSFLKTSNKVLKFILTYSFFILCLLSTEFAVTLPLLIPMIAFNLSVKLSISKTIKFLLPFVITIIFYMVLRLFIIPSPLSNDYSISIGNTLIKNYFWYFLWLLNMPEVFRYHFVLTKLQFSNDQTLINPLKPYIGLGGASFIALILSFLSLAFISVKNIKLQKNVICLLIFIIGLSPVVFFNNHTFPYYLNFASLGLLFFLSEAFSHLINKNKTLGYVAGVLFLSFWFSTSYATVSFQNQTHWVSSEESISKKIVEATFKKYPYIPPESNLIIINANLSLKQSLMDQDAFQVLYSNKALKTIYLENGKLNINNEDRVIDASKI